MKIRCLLGHDYALIEKGKGICQQKKNGPTLLDQYTDTVKGPAKKVMCLRCGKVNYKWDFKIGETDWELIQRWIRQIKGYFGGGSH